MIPLAIGIHEVGQAPLFPELAPCEEGDLTHAAILQEGRAGKTSVTFFVQLPDGKRVMAQTTKVLLESLLGAINGAEARWAEKKRDRRN